jgi:sorting nexin-25
MSDRGSVAGLGQNRAVLMAQTTKPEVAVASSLTVREVNLYTVLSDPSSLAYWLEHMERRFRSRLVQFWLTVEGLKDPLEAAAPDLALDSSINSTMTLWSKTTPR